MTTTAGSQMFELIVATKAKELIELMENTSPELIAAVSRKDKEEALMNALSYLERDPSAAPMSREIIRRAKDIVFARSVLKN